MFTSPLASLAGWSWAKSFTIDLPTALRQVFPPSAPGTVVPESEQLAVIGNSSIATSLRFPAMGRWHHHQDATSIVHWIWGRAADIAMSIPLRTQLRLGNPLIAIRFEDAADAHDYKGEPKGVTRSAAVELGGNPISTTAITIVAFAPGAPSLDTIGVLRYVRDALVNASTMAESPTWQEFVAAFDGVEQPLRLLDPGGSPLSGVTVALGGSSLTLSAAHRGDVLAALGTNRSALTGGASLDVTSLGEAAVTSSGEPFPDGIVTVTPATSHVTAAPLATWFAPQQATALERFSRKNVVRPFADGTATLADIFGELNKPMTTNNGAFYVTGYALQHDVKLGPAGLTNRSVADVATAMVADGGEPRFLALQMIQLEPSWVQTVETVAAFVAIIMMVASAGATFFQDEQSVEQPNFFLHTQLLAVAVFVAGTNLNAIVDHFEQNKEAIDALAAIPGVEAHLDPVDADVDDNPLATLTNPPISLAVQAQRRYNVFHQKIQIVNNDDGLHAYCGGIDLKSNRMQDRDHASRSPFHDVHARINGPAAAELATTFVERWKDRPVRVATVPDPDPATGLALDGVVVPPITDAPDIVQVARTYYGPLPGSGRGFSTFAPNGERTILNTLLQAIPQARRYIYIEDQYLTPPQEFAAALEAAAKTVSGPLVIVIPSTPDQPFGLARRQAFIQRMRIAWGDRFKMGILRKRFSRTATSSTAAKGRVWLAALVGEADNAIELSPASRVPDPPFWLVVDGEVMRAYHKTPGVSSPTSVKLDVYREGATNLFKANSGTTRSSHNRDAAVTTGSFQDIYVHSKIMLIDDAFASIGSANCNRRGYYSDGECNIFALRETIADGEDNWIRNLRLELWSEHLGVTPEYGRVALLDPVACLPLFDRKFITGNRFTPFDAQAYAVDHDLAAEFNETSGKWAGVVLIAKVWAAMGLALAGNEADHIFDTLIDPSSQVE